jgi:ATP-dependent Lon protease
MLRRRLCVPVQRVCATPFKSFQTWTSPLLSIPGRNFCSEGVITDGVIDSRPAGDKSITLPQIGDNSPKLVDLYGLPISRRPIFPGLMSAVMIRDEKTCAALIKSNESGMSYLSVFLRCDAKGAIVELPELITSADQIYKVGTFVQVQNMIRTDIGLQLLLMGHRRITLEEIHNFGPPLSVKIDHWQKPVFVLESPSLKAYRNEVIQAVG